MELSEQGITLLRRFEGCRLKIYRDVAGKPTIGIGHLLTPREIDEGVFDDGITQEEADALLRSDIGNYSAAVNRGVKVPIVQYQHDVLTSFTFNEGGGAFMTSTLLKRLNKGEHGAVPPELLRWDKYTDPKTGRLVAHPGLAMRRKAEGHIWTYGFDERAAPVIDAAEKALEELRREADRAFAVQFDLRDIAVPMGAHGAYDDEGPPTKKEPNA
jgi:lysozyme